MKQEIKSASDELKGSAIELSNPALLVDHSLEIIAKSPCSGFQATMITSATFRTAGSRAILFHKQFNNYRTPNVHDVLQLTHSI
jgi:hypothetical protein